jgi:hypothetical protein
MIEDEFMAADSQFLGPFEADVSGNTLYDACNRIQDWLDQNVKQ